MNKLFVGLDKEPILEQLPDRFLFIADRALVQQLLTHPFPANHDVVQFDVARHSFNPLRHITHRRAREISSLFYSRDPGGESTLTVRNGRRALARLLLASDCLDRMHGDTKDPAIVEALATVEDILFTPAVRQVLCRPDNFSMKGTVIAALDPAELGDEDCYILGNLLMSIYPHTVIVPDFGMYATGFHRALIRQNRLWAGVTALSQLPPELLHPILLIENKAGTRCTSDDAETLALYAGKARGTDGFSTYVGQCMRPFQRARA